MKELANTDLQIADHLKLHAILDEWIEDLKARPICESESATLEISAVSDGGYHEDEETPICQFYVERKRLDMI